MAKEKVSGFINQLMEGEAKRKEHDPLHKFRIIENVNGEDGATRLSFYFNRYEDDNYHFQFQRDVSREKMAVLLRSAADMIMGRYK